MQRVSGSRTRTDSDPVVVEEPLEIRLGKEPLSVTMRTPGHDEDLVAGFLYTEGILSRDLMRSGTACRAPTDGLQFQKISSNIVQVKTSGTGVKDARRLRSRFFVSSSCGLCGRMTIDSIRRRLGSIKTSQRINSSVICRLPAEMSKKQAAFKSTGGLHAAALFDQNGKLLHTREDIGRHNAVDKAIGAWLRSPSKSRSVGLKGDVLAPAVLLVSGRASFEIVQKALAAKIPIIAAVSAPSTLAIELARDSGITLIGFLRGKNFNIYTRKDRIEN
jgi:FdhD protein